MYRVAGDKSDQLGVGVGLRSPHYSYILENHPDISWFEAISENYIGLGSEIGGRPIKILEQIREQYSLVLHGVSMSIGSADDLNLRYLQNLKNLIDRINPLWVSDHICWTGLNAENLHDLMPLPYTQEVLDHLTQKILKAQDFLKRTLVFENVSAYISFKHNQMTEWEFLNELHRRTNCGLLIDINNIYVSSVNQNFDPKDFINGIPKNAVKQMHLAGHSKSGNLLVDTHDGPVTAKVWDLYQQALRKFGKIPTLIEWDDKIPDFAALLNEAKIAENFQKQEFKEAHATA